MRGSKSIIIDKYIKGRDKLSTRVSYAVVLLETSRPHGYISKSIKGRALLSASFLSVDYGLLKVIHEEIGNLYPVYSYL